MLQVRFLSILSFPTSSLSQPRLDNTPSKSFFLFKLLIHKIPIKMHGNTLLASAATIAVAAALPQIVTTVTEPTTTTYHPGYSFGFPGYGGYNSGYRGYGSGYGYGGLYGSNYGSGYNAYNPYNTAVGSASLGFLPGALGSSTSVDGYTGYQAPYVYAFPGDYKRTQGDAATLNVADSKTTLTKRQFGPFGNALANGWSNFLDNLGFGNDDEDRYNIIQNAGSATLGGIVPSFTIDNGYPAPAYPVPAYPGATYSGPSSTQVYPNVPNPGSYSTPLDQ